VRLRKVIEVKELCQDLKACCSFLALDIDVFDLGLDLLQANRRLKISEYRHHRRFEYIFVLFAQAVNGTLRCHHSLPILQPALPVINLLVLVCRIGHHFGYGLLQKEQSALLLALVLD
jgi:hypothetical protein